MKLIFTILIIAVLSVFVGAITLDNPPDGSYHSLLNIDLSTTADIDNSNVSFFVSTDTTFDSNEEVCKFVTNNSGDQLTCTFAFTNPDYAIPLNFLMHFDNHTGNLKDSIGSMGMVFNGNPTYNIQDGASNGYYNYSANNFIEDLSPSFTLASTDDFTVAAWVRVNESFISSNVAHIQGHSCNTRMLFGITSSVALGFGTVALCTDDDFIRSGRPIELGIWQFIAATYDGTSHDCKTFINGELTDSGNCFDGNGFSTTTVWRIGGGDSSYIGDIDEAWVAKGVVIDEAQMMGIYNAYEGTYFWKVNSTDGSSSSSTGIQNFTLDVTKPVIVSNLSDNETTDSSVGYNFSATDNSPINFTVDVNKINIEDGQTNEFTGTQNLIFGTNRFVATATDFAGNSDAIDLRIYREEDEFNIRYYSDKNISIRHYGDNNIIRRLFS